MKELGVVVLGICAIAVNAQYLPTWESLDKRPLPAWYDESKFGIFIVWGVYSVPSFGDEWFWDFWQGRKIPKYVEFMKKNYPPNWTYQDFASQFTAEFYNPTEWAELFKASGAKYIVLTTKHHEGYTLWPSKYSWNWNSMAVGSKRDLVGELAAALRNNTDIHLGLYHSMFEWFNPLYLQDKSNGFKTQNFVRDKTGPELYELVNAYKPDVIWSDGDAGPDTYWNSTHFLAWLYNESPVKDTVVVNDRWGTGCACKHGGYYTCHDRFNPGKLVNHKWENCMTIDRQSWGYRREAPLADYLSIENLLQILAETVSCGGNLLMNIGPTHDGRIVPIFEERLRQMGQWLKVNGEAIYATKPWSHQNDTVTKGVWYTKSSKPGSFTVYAILLFWPQPGTFILGAPQPDPSSKVTLLGYKGDAFKYTIVSPAMGMNITIPAIPANAMPCNWAWVLQIDNVRN